MVSKPTKEHSNGKASPDIDFGANPGYQSGVNTGGAEDFLIEDKRILGDWLVGYLDYQKPQESSSIYKIWVGISTIAAALERKCYMQREDTIYPNLFVILVGPSGAARKGTAMKGGSRLIRQIDGIQMAPDEITKEALVYKLSRSRKEYSEEGKEKPVSHSSLTIHCEELVTFLGYNNPEFLMNLTKMYDCQDSYERDTKCSGKDEVKGVFLNLIGAVTPTLLDAYLTGFQSGAGFTSRLIMVYSDSTNRVRKAWPDTMTQPGIDKFNILLRDLARINQLGGEFAKSEEFIEAYKDWYESGESEKVPFGDPNLEAYASRKATHCIKLCMILSASRSNSMIIELEDFEKAKKILKMTERTMPLIFSGSGRLPFSEFFPRIRFVIQAGTISSGGVDRAELSVLFNRDLLEPEISTILIGLQKSGEIYIEDGKYKYTVKDVSKDKEIVG